MVVDVVSMDKMGPLGFDGIAERTGLPAQTLRRYAKEFARWLPTRKVGRVVQFQPDAVEIIEAIRAAFEQGMTTPQVRDLLARTSPGVIDMPSPPPGPPTEDETAVETAVVTTMDSDVMAALLPLAERWVAALERQNELQARTLATMETRLAALEAARTPQEAPQPEERPEGHAEVKTAGETPFWRSLLRLFRGGGRGE